MSADTGPLNITCTSSDCDNPTNPTHCFKPLRGKDKGKCRDCGTDVVDWGRVHERNLADVANTFSALENETWRAHMMHVDVPAKVQELALRVPPEELRARTVRALRSALRKPKSQQFRDGMQTPRENSSSARIQHYAQHATATCCRQCLDYWHGVDVEAHLTDQDWDYVAALCWEYIDRRIGPLDDGSES